MILLSHQHDDRTTITRATTIALKAVFQTRALATAVKAMAENSLEAMRRRREMERREKSRKRREQLMKEVCEEVGIEADEEVQRELRAGLERMNRNFVNKREEGLNVSKKTDDNSDGEGIGDDKTVEKNGEDSRSEDELDEALTGESLSGTKILDKLAKDAKKEKDVIAEEEQRKLYYLIVLLGMLAIIAAGIIIEYVYRVRSPRYKNMWKHTGL